MGAGAVGVNDLRFVEAREGTGGSSTQAHHIQKDSLTHPACRIDAVCSPVYQTTCLTFWTPTVVVNRPSRVRCVQQRDSEITSPRQARD
jgi:hypothetical protein